MQAATKAARRLSQVMGLGNGTTSAYISATWGREPEPFDEALIPDSHSIPEVGPLSPSTAFFPSSSSRTIGQRIFMFFGVDPNANENFFRDQGEVDRALSSEPKELVSRMKRKMTTFLAITSSSESPEGSITAAESSDAAEKIIDLPSFNRSGDRKRPKQGAVKPTSYSRKRGAAISSQHQVQLLSTLQRISITFFYFSGGPLRIRAYCGSWGTRADAAWTACGSCRLGCSARFYGSRALLHDSREWRLRRVGLQSIWPVLVVCKQLFHLHLQCLDWAEFDALLQEFKMDYNQTHFVRNHDYKEAASQIQGP